MITVKINGKAHKFPISFSEVSTAQYTQLIQAKSTTDTVAVFCGIPSETLRKAKITGLEQVLSVLQFTNDKVEFSPTPNIGKYTLPKSITLESLGQFEDLRELLKQLPRKKIGEYTTEDTLLLIDLHVSACAIYCQKIRDGDYDYEKAMGMKEELYQCPITEIGGNGAFFLTRPLSLLNGTPNPSRTISPPRKSKKQASRS